MADAAAEELRNRLIQLSRQLVDLQVLVAQKDAQLAHLSQHKATLEARLASSGISGVAAAGGRRGVDYVPREQHEQLAEEAAGLKEQLVECLEELDARERELAEVGLMYRVRPFISLSTRPLDWLIAVCTLAPQAASPGTMGSTKGLGPHGGQLLVRFGSSNLLLI